MDLYFAQIMKKKEKIIKIRERIRRIIEEDDRSGYEQWRI